jgi:hypothetical protein
MSMLNRRYWSYGDLDGSFQWAQQVEYGGDGRVGEREAECVG